MSESKHTPGPWSVQREAAIDYRPNMIVGADGGSLVAWCAGGGPKRAVMGPEEDANARLIAAAPELLEALREIETIITESDAACRKHMGTRQGNALVVARAALAKAGA